MRLSPKQPRPVVQGLPAKSDARPAPRKHHGRFGRNPHCPQAELAADVDHQPSYGRMQVHVLVRVGMVEREPGGGESGELGADFGGKLPANTRTEEIINPEAELVRWKPALGVQKIRDCGPRQYGWPFDHHEMQSDAKRWQFPRPSHGIQSSRAGNHQARCIQNAVEMRLHDRLVDQFRQTEIIRGKNHAPHLPGRPGMPTLLPSPCGMRPGGEVASEQVAVAATYLTGLASGRLPPPPNPLPQGEGEDFSSAPPSS